MLPNIAHKQPIGVPDTSFIHDALTPERVAAVRRRHDHEFRDCYRHGVNGYLPKNLRKIAESMQIIDVVVNGKNPIYPIIANVVLSDFKPLATSLAGKP